MSFIIGIDYFKLFIVQGFYGFIQYLVYVCQKTQIVFIDIAVNLSDLGLHV